ncbi:hypothetical protein V2G26_020182 [Clonostachys chloroleuca]
MLPRRRIFYGTWLAIYERTFAPAHNKATLSVETATLYIHESLYRVVHSLDDKGRALALLYGASRPVRPWDSCTLSFSPPAIATYSDRKFLSIVLPDQRHSSVSASLLCRF